MDSDTIHSQSSSDLLQPMSPPILELQQAEFTYQNGKRSISAVSATTLTISKGEFVSLVGPSGCGKSTLLRLMAGLLLPTSGRILCEGEPIAGPDWKRGLSFQHPQLFPWLTLWDNVDFGPKVLGISKNERKDKVEYFLRMVKLWDFKDLYPYELSGGMQQRAALARALVNEPHILLLDEPLGALDALTREHMQDELKAIWEKTRTTIVLVTHSVDEAVYLGTRVLVSSPRPAVIVSDTAISLPRGCREGRKIKNSQGFLHLREEIVSLVWAENSELLGNPPEMVPKFP